MPELPPEYVKLAAIAIEVGTARVHLQLLEEGKCGKEPAVEEIRACIDRISLVVLNR